MSNHEIPCFTPYPFEPGQKITITAGPRRGDWEVVAVTDRKLTLRCPVSGREFTWERFCYLVETRKMEWPQQE